VKIFHLVMMIFFAIQIPVALCTELKNSVPYLVSLSLWALVSSHWSAWQATKAEKANNSD
jgi:hypothetical protein